MEKLVKGQTEGYNEGRKIGMRKGLMVDKAE